MFALVVCCQTPECRNHGQEINRITRLREKDLDPFFESFGADDLPWIEPVPGEPDEQMDHCPVCGYLGLLQEVAVKMTAREAKVYHDGYKNINEPQDRNLFEFWAAGRECARIRRSGHLAMCKSMATGFYGCYVVIEYDQTNQLRLVEGDYGVPGNSPSVNELQPGDIRRDDMLTLLSIAAERLKLTPATNQVRLDIDHRGCVND